MNLVPRTARRGRAKGNVAFFPSAGKLFSVVAQGRVYLADSEVMKPKAKERVHCFDETTGKALWSHVYEVAYENWAFDPKQAIGPVATPIIQNVRAKKARKEWRRLNLPSLVARMTPSVAVGAAVVTTAQRS
jgi:outer membrane protein assembly factor BamB